MPFELERYLADARAAVDADLERRLADPPGDAFDPGPLREGMRYAVLGGGKRLRPAVTLAAAVACGAPPPLGGERALTAASAIELLHAYTLVHDDLPAMDDDVERRGKPTVHLAFGEAEAILVGDALLTAAFGALADLGPACADAVAVLARRAGVLELLRGQAVDIGEPAPRTLAQLEALHAGKTGALFAAAAELGGIAAGAGADVRRLLADYGLALGVAFQHADDLADEDHADLAAEARRRVRELTDEARARARALGERAAALDAIAFRVGGSHEQV